MNKGVECVYKGKPFIFKIPKTKQELYSDLEGFLTESEFNPIKDKIKRYLTIYTAGVTIYYFTFTIENGRVKFINFYTGAGEYRRVAFDNYNDVFSIHHFRDNGKVCTTGLCRKALDCINGEDSDDNPYSRRPIHINMDSEDWD